MNSKELKIIADNEVLMNGLRRLFMERLNKERDSVNKNDTNEILGQKTRAYIQTEEIITKAFNDLNAHKSNNDTTGNQNRGE